MAKAGAKDGVAGHLKNLEKWTITLKMADQGKSDFSVVFTMSLCALQLKQASTSFLFQIIRR